MDAVVVRSLVIASSVACCIVLVSNKIRDRERKKKEDEFIPASTYVELYLLNRQRLLENLNAAQLAYDPLDPQTSKNWALDLISLAFMQPRELDRSRRAQWLRDAKSKLEEALKLNDKDYEIMFELGKVHHALLQLDPTVARRPYGKAYMELCNGAITYFKTVQEKAPHIFDGGSWLTEVEDFLPQKYSKDSKVDLNKEGMEGYRAMMRARIAQSAEMRARFAQSTMDDDNEMWDDDDDEIGGEQEGEYA